MNPFMFDAHHNRPPRAIPADRQRQRHLRDELVHNASYHLAVCVDLIYRGPIVMCDIQVVPAHFVHAYCKHGLHFWIDPLLHQARENQFVGKKSSGMAKVENEWMPQRYRFLEIGLVVPQNLEKLLVAIKSRMEIAPYFLAFCLDIISGKNRSSWKQGLRQVS